MAPTDECKAASIRDVCHRCERIDRDGVWLIVHQFGRYEQEWQFCSIECLGQYFEDKGLIAERDRLVAERDRLAAVLYPPKGYFFDA